MLLVVTKISCNLWYYSVTSDFIGSANFHRVVTSFNGTLFSDLVSSFLNPRFSWWRDVPLESQALSSPWSSLIEAIG